MPSNTQVIGELHVPGKPASYVSTAVASRPWELKFNAFAIQKYTGVLASAGLAEVNSYLEYWGFEAVDFYDDHRDPDWLLENLVPGTEGWVLKTGNMGDWYKLKPVLTIDLIVTGIKPGKGKFKGQAGALICSTKEGYEVANISGMDDVTRAKITKASIGRVVEVRYQYVGAKGRLRHPAFVRWRYDKKKSRCSVSQDPYLEAYWNNVS